MYLLGLIISTERDFPIWYARRGVRAHRGNCTRRKRDANSVRRNGLLREKVVRYGWDERRLVDGISSKADRAYAIMTVQVR